MPRQTALPGIARRPSRPRLMAGIALTALGASAPAVAQPATSALVYSFTGGSDSAYPDSPLSADHLGNLYGSTLGGSNAVQVGSIYKLDPQGNLTTIYAFTDASDGQYPKNVNLVHGQLMGYDLPGYLGGSPPNTTDILFSLNIDGSGFQIVHNFHGLDGYHLVGNIVPAANGGIYGLTLKGGTQFGGTLYYVAPDGRFATLVNFAKSGPNSPETLVENSSGTLFGTTAYGGGCTAFARGCGTVWEYVPSTRTFTTLYNFQGGDDGASPYLGAVGPDGTLYGTAEKSGAYRNGTLFALTPTNGTYTFSVLTPIKSIYKIDTADTPPTLTAQGALIGSTSYGGIYTWQNGNYTINYPRQFYTAIQLFAVPGHPDEILGVQQGAGSTACYGGCGLIFSAHQ